LLDRLIVPDSGHTDVEVMRRRATKLFEPMDQVGSCGRTASLTCGSQRQAARPPNYPSDIPARLLGCLVVLSVKAKAFRNPASIIRVCFREMMNHLFLDDAVAL